MEGWSMCWDGYWCRGFNSDESLGHKGLCIFTTQALVVYHASPEFPIRVVLRSSFRLSCSLHHKFSVGFPASFWHNPVSLPLSALSLIWCWEALENWECRFSEFNRFWSFRSHGVERIWKIESANFGIQQVLKRPRLIFVCEGANRD